MLLSRAQRIKCKKAFKQYDANNTGRLTVDQVRQALEDMNMNYREAEVKEILYSITQQSLQKNNNEQTFDFDDFLNLITMKLKDCDHDEEIQRTFTAMDLDQDNFISINDLKKICEELKMNTTIEELNEIVKSIAETNDGKITFEEFKKAMNGI